MKDSEKLKKQLAFSICLTEKQDYSEVERKKKKERVSHTYHGYDSNTILEARMTQAKHSLHMEQTAISNQL